MIRLLLSFTLCIRLFALDTNGDTNTTAETNTTTEITNLEEDTLFHAPREYGPLCMMLSIVP